MVAFIHLVTLIAVHKSLLFLPPYRPTESVDHYHHHFRQHQPSTRRITSLSSMKLVPDVLRTATSSSNSQQNDHLIHSDSKTSVIPQPSVIGGNDLIKYPAEDTTICSLPMSSSSLSSPIHLESWSHLHKSIWTTLRGQCTYKLIWKTSTMKSTATIARTVASKIEPWFATPPLSATATTTINNSDNNIMTKNRQMDIQKNIDAYVTFTKRYIQPDMIRGYKVTVSAMHGSTATRCPAWHCDYVPVRSILTLHGPGTMYIDPATNPYEGDEGLQSMIKNEPPAGMTLKGRRNPTQWKDKCLKEHSTAVPSQAATGQILFLIGRQWSQVVKEDLTSQSASSSLSPSSSLSESSTKAMMEDSDVDFNASAGLHCPGVLHRSPFPVEKRQGRVLMTIDVLLAHKDHGENCDCGHDSDVEDIDDNDDGDESDCEIM